MKSDIAPSSFKFNNSIKKMKDADYQVDVESPSPLKEDFKEEKITGYLRGVPSSDKKLLGNQISANKPAPSVSAAMSPRVHKDFTPGKSKERDFENEKGVGGNQSVTINIGEGMTEKN